MEKASVHQEVRKQILSSSDSVTVPHSKQDTRARRFSRTCSLLSKYINDGGTIGNLSPQLYHGDESREPKTSLALLPGAGSESSNDTNITPPKNANRCFAPMTIFYRGNVVVLNDYPSDKADELMLLASNASSAVDSVIIDVPQARRASLKQFLMKRRDRIESVTPYKMKRSRGSDSPHVALELSL